jgi:ABC-type uncharacterized transport system ATPase subunit
LAAAPLPLTLREAKSRREGHVGLIESITISSVATFETTPVQINGLSLFNFFFGSNGTGKTTVCRVIAEETKFPTCSVKWKAGTKLQPDTAHFFL